MVEEMLTVATASVAAKKEFFSWRGVGAQLTGWGLGIIDIPTKLAKTTKGILIYTC